MVRWAQQEKSARKEWGSKWTEIREAAEEGGRDVQARISVRQWSAVRSWSSENKTDAEEELGAG